MYSLALFGCVVGMLGAAVTLPLQIDKATLGESYPNQLTFLGTVDERSFFLDGSIRKNWSDARSYCISFNMTLASVETHSQTEFLLNSFRQIGHVEYANTTWTAGRYSPPPEDFKWDNTGKRPHLEEFERWGGIARPYYYCIRFYVTPSSFEYTSDDCERLLSVLCSI